MIKITRKKLERRQGKFAWSWLYTVHAPDAAGNPEMTGEGLGWAKAAAERAINAGRATGPVVCDW